LIQVATRRYAREHAPGPDFVLRGVRLAPPILEAYDPDPVCLPDEVCGEERVREVVVGVAEGQGYPPVRGR
jgi:hypothetical protein